MLVGALSGSPGVEEITGRGLMLGLKTKRAAADVIKQCINDGVLCLSAKDRVRLLPPLNTPDSLLLRAAEIIKNACKGE